MHIRGERMIRNGRQYIESLQDGRAVYINGGRADDVTTHAAYRRAVASVGALYDFQSAPENKDLMTFVADYIGRAPDHVASCISGMYMGLDVFEAYDPKRAQALQDYYRFARDNSLYLTYVIINPQADRSKSAGKQKSEYLTA